MHEMQIPVGELTFSARAAGPDDGELVVLLHGFPESSWEWRQVMPALAEAGYRVLAPDQRGYSPGARPVARAAYGVRHLVADVLAIADWLGGHTFHLVGHDWGSIVAWVLAARYPERLRTLTSVSVPHPQPFAAARASDADQQARSSYIALFRDPSGAAEQLFLADDAAGLRAVFAELSDADADEYVRLLSAPGALTAALNWYRAWDQEVDSIGPVSVPTLYVWSTEDVALGRTAAVATADWVTGPYRFEVLDGVSHWVPETAADRLNPLLLDHLASRPLRD